MPDKRIRTLAFFVIAIALLIVGRLFWIQIVHGGDYAEEANRQYLASPEGLYDRGNIYFREKDGSLLSAATLQSGFIIALNPSLVTDPEDVFKKLSNYLTLDKEEFLTKAAKKSDPYEEIARRVPENTAKAIEELKLSGISIYKERWRYYPGQNLASNVVGFVGYDETDNLSGRYGVERSFNEVLVRKVAHLYNNFFAELFSDIGNTLFARDKAREGDVVLTIEPQVEQVLEEHLERVMKEWNAESVGGIILDPYTGDIIAMAGRPDFDPNEYGKASDQSVYVNKSVESVFEMGSIIKSLTMSAGLDAGVISADTKYNDKGFVDLDGKHIENFDGKGRGLVPMQEVLNQSLNTGAVFVESKLGNERFRNYMYAFGLGDTTGVDLPGEVAGLTDNLESTRDVEYATAAFGQGIALTPIATARALAALGNGGYLIKPHVISRVDYKFSGSEKREPIEQGHVIKTETSEEITRMLVKVVDTALAGGTAKLTHYSIAAKTGTAQIAKPEGGGYYDDRYLHSFFGYFPAYHPRFLVFLYLYYPKEVKYASQTLTGPFMDLTKFLINYYEIAPDR